MGCESLIIAMKDKVKILIVIGSLLSGALVGVGILPQLFYILPNDMIRVKNIHDALNSEDLPKPQIVILGNSVVMNGIDGQLMSDSLPQNPTVWNLSSPGQSLLESGLILDEIGFPVNSVIIGIIPSLLTTPQINIPKNKLIAYRIYQYQPSEEVIEEFLSTVDDQTRTLLIQSQWRTVIESRWIVRAFIDNSIMTSVLNDITWKRAQTDLYYPVAYTKKPSPAKHDSIISRLHRLRSSEEGKVPLQNQKILEYYWKRLNKHGIKLYVLVLPEHPNQIKLSDIGYYENLEEDLASLINGKENFHIINFYNLLSKDDFVDHIHPYQTGAYKLTDALAKQLTTPRVSQ